ncbi:hypothetical protein M3Y99_00033800 [Aphelenchoides fujianensis]|nr:hypothetical protein M3Y99_00033800 [Aphelenchoides fujianensis]
MGTCERILRTWAAPSNPLGCSAASRPSRCTRRPNASVRTSQPIRMDVCFLSGGTTHDPIDYALVGDHGEAIRIESRQKGKTAEFCPPSNDPSFQVVPRKRQQEERMFTCSTPVFLSGPPPAVRLPAPPGVPEASEHPRLATEVRDVLTNLRNTPDSRGIFEIRPVDPFQFGGLTHEQRPVAVWLRLREHLQEVRIEDRMTVPLLLSDYVVGLPSTNAFDIRRIRVKTMASMNHKPKGFFLQIEEAECINGMSLTRGRILTKDGRPVLSYVQQGYFQLDEAVISKI